MASDFTPNSLATSATFIILPASYLVNNNVVEEEGLSLNKVLSYAISYWKLLLFSVLVCVVAAFLYLRVAVPQYKVTAKILMQDKEKGSFASQTDMLIDFGFQAQNTNVENEIEVIKSMSVVRGAVENAELYISYSMPGFHERPIYKERISLLTIRLAIL